ncbi:MAG: CoA-binding protein [Candidatus Altiarchaeales archaeon]|nr:CoA-binding protein [Candidatus Altiarchaeales archaeon]
METEDLGGFLGKENRVAVVGVSGDHEKWGYRIYDGLRSAGFNVCAVNPRYEEVDGSKCYPDLESIPESKKPDVVVTVVPPNVTEQIVIECRNLGIKKIWMQPGSESKESIDFCRESDICVVYNACFVVDGLKQKNLMIQ